MKEYAIMNNGIMKNKMRFSDELSIEEIVEIVVDDETIKLWMDSKEPKKIIVVPNKIINIINE